MLSSWAVYGQELITQESALEQIGCEVGTGSIISSTINYICSIVSYAQNDGIVRDIRRRKMSRVKKPVNSQYIKIPKKLWLEVIHLLREAPDHLDFDFDWEGSDKYETKVQEAVGKVINLDLPIGE